MKLAAAGLLCALMTACGGGGEAEADSGKSPPPEITLEEATPEGSWSGRIDEKRGVSITVLENGEIWGFLLGDPSTTADLFGSLSYNGPVVTGQWKYFKRDSGLIVVEDFTGNVHAKGRMDITLSNGTQIALGFSRPYEQPANARDLVGTYEGVGGASRTPSSPWFTYTFPSGETVQIPAHNAHTLRVTTSISESGQLNIVSTKDCSASGTILPRATGKNVFDVNAIFQGSECVLDNGTVMHGIATSDAKGSISIQVFNDAKTEAVHLHNYKQ